MPVTWSHFRTLKLLYVQINPDGTPTEKRPLAKWRGLGLGLQIALLSGKPAGKLKRQMACICTRCALEQAASPWSPEYGRASGALGADRFQAPGSRQPRAVAALALLLLGARPEQWVWFVDSPL